jgi:1-acyl-sn-glycerol-3-phosphate acyltransferase
MASRNGAVAGTPETCREMLEAGEAVLVFPEGVRGMNKLYRDRYKLQRMGLGFMRLALEAQVPIVPVAVVGSEEQQPGLANLRGIAGALGMPAFPVTPTFPLLGPLGLLPLPVKYRIYFGEPMQFEGSPTDEDGVVQEKVDRVREAIEALFARGLEERRGVFR